MSFLPSCLAKCLRKYSSTLPTLCAWYPYLESLFNMWYAGACEYISAMNFQATIAYLSSRCH